MPPLIGITTSQFVSPKGWRYVRAYEPVVQAIADTGGLPVLIPVSVSDEVLRQTYARVDGVLLPGGGDIDPKIYGEPTHPLTANIDPDRDRVEIKLAQWAVDDDLPLMGICRGHQVFNVAMGGTLVQDIPSELGTTILHDIEDDTPRGRYAHQVKIDPTSRLSAILGAIQLPVNSIHHQSVATPFPGSRVTALAPDEVVEGLELPGKRFALSVQWHPEDMYQDDPVMMRLFRAFVEAASSGVNR